MQKKVIAMHDISCFGKCSLTIALPILSAMNVETALLPTAILSTHTGGLGRPHKRDLTSDLSAILTHWKSQHLTFDAIYSGYLASESQIEKVQEVYSAYPNALRFVDPVMGDHGVRYSSIPESFPSAFRTLCKNADVIMPNMSEASFLLEEPYLEGVHCKSNIEHILRRLAELGARFIVLTGVSLHEHEIGAAAYDHKTKEIYYCMQEKVPMSYHGTGDVFGSVLVGSMVKGLHIKDAVQIAVDYTAQCIKQSYEDQKDERYGVNFESSLSLLTSSI